MISIIIMITIIKKLFNNILHIPQNIYIFWGVVFAGLYFYFFLWAFLNSIVGVYCGSPFCPHVLLPHYNVSLHQYHGYPYKYPYSFAQNVHFHLHVHFHGLLVSSFFCILVPARFFCMYFFFCPWSCSISSFCCSYCRCFVVVVLSFFHALF